MFEHLNDPFEVASALALKLRKGGILKVSVPKASDIERRLANNDWNAPKYTRNSLNPLAPLEHVNCWNLKSLASLGNRVGLELVPFRWTNQWAFFRHGAIPWTAPKEFAKAILRPIHRNYSSYNLYAWLKRTA